MAQHTPLWRSYGNVAPIHGMQAMSSTVSMVRLGSATPLPPGTVPLAHPQEPVHWTRELINAWVQLVCYPGAVQQLTTVSAVHCTVHFTALTAGVSLPCGSADTLQARQNDLAGAAPLRRVVRVRIVHTMRAFPLADAACGRNAAGNAAT